jgi:hypothetical protein
MFLDQKIVDLYAGGVVGPFSHDARFDIPMARWEAKFLSIL